MNVRHKTLKLRALLVAFVTLGAAAYGDANEPAAPPPEKLPPPALCLAR